MKITSINSYQSNIKNRNIQASQNKNQNFGIIKPEYMFINSKGYAQNNDWANTVVDIINSGKQLAQKRTKFDDLIEYVANRYNAYYQSFGPFLGNQYFGTRRFTIIENMLCNKYEPYSKRAIEFVEKNTTDNSYKMSAYLPSQKKAVELTNVKYNKLNDNEILSYVEAPNTNVIDPVMKEVASIYKGIEKENDFDKIVNSTAKIHWFISQARPYTRGSAGIADMLSKIIFESKGIQVSAYKKDVNPNIEAFVMPIEEYCEKYPTFFTEPLKKLN